MQQEQQKTGEGNPLQEKIIQHIRNIKAIEDYWHKHKVWIDGYGYGIDYGEFLHAMDNQALARQQELMEKVKEVLAKEFDQYYFNWLDSDDADRILQQLDKLTEK
jgi:hypothetical protein